MTDWLIDRLIDRLIDWLIDVPIGTPSPPHENMPILLSSLRFLYLFVGPVVQFCAYSYNFTSETTESSKMVDITTRGWGIRRQPDRQTDREKKLWRYVGGGNEVIWLYQLSWKCKLATVTSYKADVLCQRDWRNCGFCVGLYGESGATLLVGT